jgi:hypothetical protein
MFIVYQCGAVVVIVEQLLFDWHVPGSTHALCCFVCYLLINSKFEFLAKKDNGQNRTGVPHVTNDYT